MITVKKKDNPNAVVTAYRLGEDHPALEKLIRERNS